MSIAYNLLPEVKAAWQIDSSFSSEGNKSWRMGNTIQSQKDVGTSHPNFQMLVWKSHWNLPPFTRRDEVGQERNCQDRTRFLRQYLFSSLNVCHTLLNRERSGLYGLLMWGLNNDKCGWNKASKLWKLKQFSQTWHTFKLAGNYFVCLFVCLFEPILSFGSSKGYWNCHIFAANSWGKIVKHSGNQAWVGRHFGWACIKLKT